MKLLLVEDDARLAGAVRTWMGYGGIEVEWISLGQQVEPALNATHYDWVVLDLGLPDQEGETALARLRAAGHDLPVLVMTAREQVQDRVRLLDLGADDFLVKPVHLEELAARLRAVKRRHGAAPDATLRHGPLRLTPASRTVTVDGTYVALTHHEFRLLEALLQQRGRALAREQLLQAMGAEAEEAVGNAVDVHVHHLRRKLGAGLIRTVRGVGYSLGPLD